MKKKRNIGIALLVTAGLLIIFTSAVYASALLHGRPPVDPSDEQDQTTSYYGPMQGFGMWRSEEDTTPPMMDAMVDAISEATGLSVDEIEAKLAEGEHLYTIAADAGMTDEDFDALMDDVHESFFDQIREQMGNSDRFEWMFNHMEEEWEEHGFGAYSQDSESPYPFENGTGRFGGGCW